MTIEGYPITPQQQRVWRRTREGAPARAQVGILLEGKLVPSLLQESLDDFIRGHEILRTRLAVPAFRKTPVQSIAAEPSIAWQETQHPGMAPAEALAAVFEQGKALPAPGPDEAIVHAELMIFSPQRHVLALNLPAYLCDGWSLARLHRGLAQCYEGRVNSRPVRVEPPVQYPQYTEWLWQLEEEAEEGTTFWVQRHETAANPPVLPSDGGRSNGQVRLRRKTPALLASVVGSGHDPETFLAACWHLFLARMAAKDDMSLAVADPGRCFEELETVPGLFVRHLPFTYYWSRETVFNEGMQAIRACLAEAAEWREYYELRHEHGELPYAFEWEVLPPPVQAGPVSLRCLDRYMAGAVAVLKLNTVREGDHLFLDFYYDPGQWTREIIDEWSDHFQNLAAAAVAHPGIPALRLPLLDGDERRRVLFGMSRQAPTAPLVTQRFENVAAAHPEQTALVFADPNGSETEARVRFAELRERTHRLAACLRAHGIGPERVVALCLERSAALITAMLGVLEAGGAYLPLEPQTPDARLREMVRAAGARVVLVPRGSDARFQDWRTEVEVLALNPWGELNLETSPVHGFAISRHQAAYLLFTSGSTGQPKAVVVCHAHLVHYLAGLESRLPLATCTSYALVSTPAADLGNTVLYAALCRGGTLHLPGEETVLNPRAFAAYCRRHQVDCLKITPSHLAVLLAAGEGGAVLPRQCLVLGGEAAAREWVVDLARQRPGTQIFNHYGPTETTVGVTVHGHDRGLETKTFPLGKPLPGNHLYVLNALLEPAPRLVSGMLHIGGGQVSRGYHGRPHQTAERFLPDPFLDEPGARMYHTGDRVRLGPDERFEFLGRADGQVKIRGYRIELGEVEAALVKLPGIQKVAVIARRLHDQAGEQALVAFLTSAEDVFDERATRQELTRTLPSYMVPAVFVVRDVLPLNANGKIDRPALRALPVRFSGEQAHREAPRGPVEGVLARIWAEVLGLAEVGATDTIFELGGHSLMLIMLNTRIRAIFGSEPGIHRLFAKPTIREIARFISEQETVPGEAGQRAERLLAILDLAPEEKIRRLQARGMAATLDDAAGIPAKLDLLLLHGPSARAGTGPGTTISKRPDGAPPLSFDQERLWLLDQLEGPSAAYNNPLAARFTGILNPHVLDRCLAGIERRHEVLRTTISARTGEPAQRVHAPRPSVLAVVDFTHLPAAAAEAVLRPLRDKEGTRPFDLEKGPVWRAVLARLTPTDHVLMLSMHHICSDGWSMRIFVSEAAALYDHHTKGGPFPLKPLPIQYADYAHWQRSRLQGERHQRLERFWREYLRGAPLEPMLPGDRARPKLQTYGGASHSIRFAPSLAESLEALSGQRQASLFMTLLSAFYVWLYRESGCTDLVVGTDVANRDQRELEPLIGFFINQLALRLRLEGNPTMAAWIDYVREQTLAAYTHQEMPFDRVVKTLNVDRNLSYSPVFQVKLFLQHEAGQARETGLDVRILEPETVPARLDVTLGLWRDEHGIHGWLNYNPDLFDAATVARWASHLQRILETMVGKPDIRLKELAGSLAAAEKADVRQAQHRLLQNTLLKFRGNPSAPPRAPLPETPVELVTWSEWAPGQRLPLVARPTIQNIDPTDWMTHQRSLIEEKLHGHGAILFRGFGIDSVPAFEGPTRVLIDEIFKENAEHRPITEDGAVQVPVDYAADLHLLWHNENSFNLTWPSKILFACARPASHGGETPLVDSREVFNRLRPALKHPFMEKGLLYVRNYDGHLGLGWRKVFRTDSRAEVEAKCREANMSFAWREGDGLVTRAVRPATMAHPITGEWCWFNQAQHWHFSCLDPVTRASIAAVYHEKDYPRHCYYGDGSPIDDAVMAEILDVYRELEVSFPWQKGDLLLVDNLLTAHARNPYRGERQILVSMGDMRSFESCALI